MGFFNVLRKALGVATKAAEVAEKVVPMVGVAEVLVDEVAKTVKPKSSKKKAK